MYAHSYSNWISFFFNESKNLNNFPNRKSRRCRHVSSTKVKSLVFLPFLFRRWFRTSRRDSREVPRVWITDETMSKHKRNLWAVSDRRICLYSLFARLIIARVLNPYSSVFALSFWNVSIRRRDSNRRSEKLIIYDGVAFYHLYLVYFNLWMFTHSKYIFDCQ